LVFHELQVRSIVAFAGSPGTFDRFFRFHKDNRCGTSPGLNNRVLILSPAFCILRTTSSIHPFRKEIGDLPL
jgi:hypothetical protein